VMRVSGDLQPEVLDELVQLGEQLRPLAGLHVRRLHADQRARVVGLFGSRKLDMGHLSVAAARLVKRTRRNSPALHDTTLFPVADWTPLAAGRKLRALFNHFEQTPLCPRGGHVGKVAEA